jgi:hypothetical protein
VNALQRQLMKRRADRMYKEGGWGPQLSFPVERKQGKPLVFQIRIPDSVELIDVPRLAGAARGAPATVGRAAVALERAKDAAGLIVVAALCATKLEPDSEREVLATLTVALADVTGPPPVEDYAVADSDRTVRSDREVTQISDRVTQVKRLSLEALEPGQEPTPMLTIQYLMQTRYGALIMAFSTTHKEMFGEWGRGMFRKIAEGIFIGEKPRLY